MKNILILLMILITFSKLESKTAIIANKSVPAKVDKGTIIDLYNLDKKKVGDLPITLFTFSTENDATKSFFSYIGSSNSNCKKTWLKKKLTGEGEPPASVGEPAAMIDKVAKTPGAIGYVDASKVTSDVQVLAEID